uniref:ubiquitinyl hydrolase 1 n=1 Tax=Chromera velia CCMP2878 TaxID=1169474 RepID=A0A0G4FS50_9ALVE|eukprot:Cvel_18511.t1-p1 / transcript=Cvel_18511.t1 / gene=Cvel_18511 / organism=Chromera_velia_CCMP2878 / gene_product=hypothetical protein / transcript_product=hypothetical protein / location=Cvel_scaffold1537:37839-42146(+) / protein_length=917 / sequence_SO=supercontig / SO=protein_coding / is_pseudo=false
MAVPFAGKDTPKERDEFGHVHLHYYHEGLTVEAFRETIEVLKEDDRAKLTGRAKDLWPEIVKDVPLDVLPESMRRFEGLDLSDIGFVGRVLYTKLRRSMRVIDLWLSVKVFPKECRQYKWKLSSTAWDICKPTGENEEWQTVGFSGTVDSHWLLPLYVQLRSLPQLGGTNGAMLFRLMRPENDGPHKCMEAGIDDFRLVASLVSEEYPVPFVEGEREAGSNIQRAPCRVLIDAGALVKEKEHRLFAKHWLNASEDPEVDAAVYFGADDRPHVLDREGGTTLLALSPFVKRLGRCLVYMDEIHCRGQDLKFPPGTRACVTVDRTMTKDKLVQSAMRLRQLGNGQAVTFWANHAAGLELRKRALEERGRDLGKWRSGNTQQLCLIVLMHILRQTCEAAVEKLRRGAPLFAQAAELHFRQLYRFLEREKDARTVKELYGGSREICTLASKYGREGSAFSLPDTESSASAGSVDLMEKLREWCDTYGADARVVRSGADEEQEKEVEVEIEVEKEAEVERERELPPPFRPKEPEVHEEIQRLLLYGTLPPSVHGEDSSLQSHPSTVSPDSAFVSPPSLFRYSPSVRPKLIESAAIGLSPRLLVSREMLDVTDRACVRSLEKRDERNNLLLRPDCYLAVVFEETFSVSSSSAPSPVPLTMSSLFGSLFNRKATAVESEKSARVRAVAVLTSFEAAWAFEQLPRVVTDGSGVSVEPEEENDESGARDSWSWIDGQTDRAGNGRFGSSLSVSLRPFAPRLRPVRSTLFWNDSLAAGAPLPKCLRKGGDQMADLAGLVDQVGVLMGSLYLELFVEQDRLCDFLGIFPLPRTPHEQEAVDRLMLTSDDSELAEGRSASRESVDCFFPPPESPMRNLRPLCRFREDPSTFVLEAVRARGRGAETNSVTGASHLTQLLHRQRRVESLED